MVSTPRGAGIMYTELQTTTNFSFLRGGSHPHELVARAAQLGYKELAITDRNTLAGIVRAHSSAKEHLLRIIPACRLDLQDGPALLAYPTNKSAYALLTSLLTLGNTRAEKGECFLYKADVYQHAKGIKFISIPPDHLNAEFGYDNEYTGALKEYREALGADLYIAATKKYTGDDQKQLYQIAALAKQLNMPMVATNDVHYHTPARRQLQDIVTCIREKCTIYNAGYRLHANAERYLKPAAEMQRLFRQYPSALTYTQEIAEACQFSLDELKYEYPDEIITPGRTPMDELTHLAWQGATDFYGSAIPQKVIDNINHELSFIAEMNYASYFLTVYDIVRFARSQGILCQGRGSAANSTVCFTLGITAVDPTKFDLLFERFLSAARNEPPDIDVDFEHSRREEVMQYIYRKYGRDRAAIVATVTQQHSKGAIRDVAKAMGLSLDAIDRLAGSVGSLGEYPESPMDTQRITEQGFDLQDKHLRKVLELTRQYIGFPRQLGQHTGGFVMTKGKLSDLVPILNARMENRTCIEWNKDDIDELGWLKVDVLALGMLTCIRKTFDLAKEKYALDLTLANIPQDDPQVYEMISRADTIGVFQIESRAQQSMLPRLKPRCFYDLVIEVAIVRPGPIQGDMVHPYLRRRNGEEPVEFPSKELEDILSRTLGVPLFQEQAMKIAIVAGGFTPTEADKLRKSMATFKNPGMVTHFKEKLITGMVKNGYALDYAERVFKQLEGFGSYGFPESHAASFAHLVYISSWIKCYYPDVFACAILNSLPMGFYQPAQLIADAQQHGVEVRAVDINYSHWDNTLEEKGNQYFILRLGFRHIGGLREGDVQLIVSGRSQPYTGINQLRNLGVSAITLEKLADADAFRSLGLDRRQALWDVSKQDSPTGIFAPHHDNNGEQNISLPEMSPFEHVLQDYATTALSIKAHPVSFVREKLKQLLVLSAADLANAHDGDMVRVSGLVLVRQRPGTAKGVCFMTIEDETGTVNAIIFENLFKQYRKEITLSKLIMLEGKLQKQGAIIHVIVEQCFNFSRLFLDAKTGTVADTTAAKQGRQLSMFHKGRNFR
ncbi:error-prone DNA polymerase [Niastella koreensis]|uniref:Error-prone DNA polymerase n=2 Tax=Niastella koreensis TaxID=354356 RepID=G8TFT0_NIAKG|nr:error-prone DNA polymerase [Niastella koreensis]AEV99519.1 Error-prone DNA polymerase [Niastella koreensis GR20-10]OQP50111.1 error-prone DNA polymerase [Niastella koreensis]